MMAGYIISEIQMLSCFIAICQAPVLGRNRTPPLFLAADMSESGSWLLPHCMQPLSSFYLEPGFDLNLVQEISYLFFTQIGLLTSHFLN